MTIRKIYLENITVFSKLEAEFCDGINLFIGENGTGKTHIMKVLYSACQASKTEVSFSNKLVRVFKPDDLNISRLSSRKAGTVNSKIKVFSDKATITSAFNNRTRKWDADTTGKDKWEKQMNELESIFIPAKEILSNSWNLEAAVVKNNVDFDDTYIDIIASAKIDISEGNDSNDKRKFLEILQRITTGKVLVEKEKFYLRPGNKSKIEFSLVAEGIRKIALLWQLIKNGTLEKGAVLFWDEPEANINPIHIPIIVEMLYELQRNGVQIFISTHDYIFAKYFEIKCKESDSLTFFSLYKQGSEIMIEKAERFSDLKENPISKAFETLLDEVYTAEVEG